MCRALLFLPRNWSDASRLFPAWRAMGGAGTLPYSALVLMLCTIYRLHGVHCSSTLPPATPVTSKYRICAHDKKRVCMDYDPVNLARKFNLFDEQWKPKVIAEMNDYQFKIVRLEGDFVWHEHAETDETFLVIEGTLRIDFRDGAVTVAEGEMFVVPRGVQHKPFAEREAKVLLIEPRGVRNTGDAGGDRTAPNDVWI